MRGVYVIKKEKGYKEGDMVLSLDASSKATGWAIIENNIILASGVYCPIGGKWKRINSMSKFIGGLISKFKVKWIIIENIQLQGKFGVKTFKVLSELRGAIFVESIDKNVKESHMISLYPSEWRKVLKYNQGRSVKREDLKNQSMIKIKDYTSKECSEDEAEAILIGMSWLKFQKGGI